VRGLPLGGAGSVEVGYGLWRNMPAALGMEAVLLGAGFLLYRSAGPRPLGTGLLLTALAVFQAGGQLWGPPPPGPDALAAASLAMHLAVVGLLAWLDRPAKTGRIAPP
jgi:hypothetical protein